MRVIVTRPEPECSLWVHRLAGQGLDAVALPLIQIGPARDSAGVHHCWERLADYDAVMFVSGAAVAHFFAARRPGDRWNPGTSAAAPRCWAPGPGTVTALQRQGVDPTTIDAPAGNSAQFDSEALWRVVGGRDHQGCKVLIVRGGDGAGDEGADASDNVRGVGREWLTDRLTSAGALVWSVAVYERRAPAWNTSQRNVAHTAAYDGSVWLFTSSQAVANLQALLPVQSWGRARALATHPRIAKAAIGAGFGVVRQSRPRVEDVVASIESDG